MVEQGRGLGVRRGAKAEQDLSALAELVAEAQDRRHADPPADQQVARFGIGRHPEADAERARQPQALASGYPAQPLGARADRLEQELERAVPACARVREGARHIRSLAVGAPALGRGEHVELPGPWVGRAVRIPYGEQPVRAQLPVRLQGRKPPAERRLRARLAHRCAGRPVRGCSRAAAPAAVACSSWSERISGAASRDARIARWAALAPVIVVMHGIPRPTAARRIS